MEVPEINLALSTVADVGRRACGACMGPDRILRWLACAWTVGVLLLLPLLKTLLDFESFAGVLQRGVELTKAAASGPPGTAPTTTLTPPRTTLPPLVDLRGPLSCLRMTTPALQLHYPEDADAHFQQLIDDVFTDWQWYSLERLGHNYHTYLDYQGPWIENHWINMVLRLWKTRGPGVMLRDLFGPYIPILLPFTDVANQFMNDKEESYPRMIEALRKALRPGVPYIAISQFDDGLVGFHSGHPMVNTFMAAYPNVLVMSAGGYGHVPVPLQLRPLRMRQRKHVRDRKYFTSFLGKLESPQNIRVMMNRSLIAFARKENIPVFIGRLPEWINVMLDSKASLCPRGYGRGSFHTLETLQLGLVPIHVYSDVPWVPYADLFHTFGFVVHFASLDNFFKALLNTSDSRLEGMEKQIVALRKTHFEMDGILEQILKFLTGRGGGGDLKCQKLPYSPLF